MVEAFYEGYRGRVAGRLAEVAAAGGFGPPHAVAPFDDVEVELEDALLGEQALEQARNHQLTQFPDGAS